MTDIEGALRESIARDIESERDSRIYFGDEWATWVLREALTDAAKIARKGRKG